MKLRTIAQDSNPSPVESFDTLISWGLVQSLLWLFLCQIGKPSKKDYRKYKIKTVVGPDDYASMREVIRGRHGRVQRDGLTPPDGLSLMVVSGQLILPSRLFKKS